jgi:hypothetical protein
MLPDRQTMPRITRLINRAGEILTQQLMPFLRLAEEELLETVSNRLELDDFGDSYFMAGFRCLIESIQNDTELSFLGALLQRLLIEKALENRLRFVEFKKRNPAIFKKNLIPPIIIMGLPRSGTTFLHRLMSQDPRNRGLYLWELIRHVPPPGKVDLRRIIAKAEYQTFKKVSIPLDHIHVIRDNEYEECMWLLSTTFHSGSYYVMAPVYSYAIWCSRVNRFKTYKEYLQFLKIFQAETPGKRLTLKAPVHTGSLMELRKLIPDAIIIQTHRNPLEVYNSSNSLIYWAHSNVVKKMDVKKMAEFNLNLLGNEIDRNLEARKTNGIKVHDVFYEELLSDPLLVAQKIYHAHGIELNEQTKRKMKAFVRKNPQHKHGNHNYCFDDFGVKKNKVVERFEEYMKISGYLPS